MEEEINYILKEFEINNKNYKIKKIDVKEDFNEIEKFNKDLEKIKKYDNKLKEFLINFKINDYEEISISNDKKYKGELCNKKPEGIGILYNGYSIRIEYIGHFKNGKYEGYGREYDYRLKYLGFFSEGKYNGIGYKIYYYIGYFKNGNYHDYGKKIKNNLFYEGYFYENKCQGKGIIYYDNKNIYINGEFNNNILINGKLYDPEGKLIYNGDFINENPKEGKNLKIYIK